MEKGKVQSCAVTGETAAPSALLRFVLSPDAKVVFDRRQDLPGNGVWISPRLSLVEEATKSGAFTVLGQIAEPLDGLAEGVGRQLREQALNHLNLIRRSGSLIAGFEKVKVAITKGALAIVQAHDASQDGKAKLEKLAEHHHLLVIGCYSRDELAAVTGQENQAHIALLRGGLTKKFIAESLFYMAYQGG